MKCPCWEALKCDGLVAKVLLVSSWCACHDPRARYLALSVEIRPTTPCLVAQDETLRRGRRAIRYSPGPCWSSRSTSTPSACKASKGLGFQGVATPGRRSFVAMLGDKGLKDGRTSFANRRFAGAASLPELAYLPKTSQNRHMSTCRTFLNLGCLSEDH